MLRAQQTAPAGPCPPCPGDPRVRLHQAPPPRPASGADSQPTAGPFPRPGKAPSSVWLPRAGLAAEGPGRGCLGPVSSFRTSGLQSCSHASPREIFLIQLDHVPLLLTLPPWLPSAVHASRPDLVQQDRGIPVWLDFP